MQYDKVSVTILAKDGNAEHGGLYADVDCDIGLAIAAAITKLDPPRTCRVVASIVEALADWGELDTENFFPCHVNAVDDLCIAAQKIIEGWDDLDRRLGI